MSLTHRETEVLALIAGGNTQARVAKVLCVSYDTVNFHIDKLKEKLGAKNTTNAVAIAIREKIIS